MRLRDLSIIQYQNVSEAPHIHRLWLSVDAFKKQIDYLATNDFGILSMDDAIRYMERKKDTTDGRPISLTFDNGYQDFQQHLFPLLSQYHFPATVLISPSKVGSSIKMGTNQVRYLSWTALRELAENNITIGAYEDYAWNINDIPENLVRRHIVEHKGPNRAERRKMEAQARHKGMTPHDLNRRKPNGWRGSVAAWRHPCKRVAR